jgi:hypothetical protein
MQSTGARSDCWKSTVMPWYAVVYITVLLGLGASSLRDAVRDRRAPAFIAFDALVSLTWPAFVVLAWHPGWSPPKAVVLLLLLVALGASLRETWRELRAAAAARPEAADPELSPAANLWIDRIVEASGALLAWALILPALIAAVRLIQGLD